MLQIHPQIRPKYSIMYPTNTGALTTENFPDPLTTGKFAERLCQMKKVYLFCSALSSLMRNTTGTELGGSAPNSVITILMYSAGVTSYIRFRRLRLGCCLQFWSVDGGDMVGEEDPSVEGINSSGFAVNLS